MNESVFLSIVIPMYNTGSLVIKCLESLTNQTCKDFEVIIVDDGSLDNSYEIAEQYLETTKLNYYIYKQENSGVSSARNFGINHSKGRYLFFLDSDDFIDKEMVEKTQFVANQSDIEIIYFGYDKVDDDNRVLWSYEDSFRYIDNILNGKTIMQKMLDKEMHICTLNAVYKREIINDNNLRYLEDCCNGEDQNFIFKALLMAKSSYNIKEILSHYFIRNTSISNSFSLKRLTLIKAFEDLCDFIESNSNDRKIANLIREEHIPINLLYNISAMSRTGTVKQIVKLLKNENIKKYLKLFVENNRNNNNIRLKIYARMALFSPTIFAFCLTLRR